MKTEQKSNVSVAAENHANIFYIKNSMECCELFESSLWENRKSNFIDGANWQKEQDKAIIEELLEALKMANNLAEATYGKEFKEWVESPILELAISKAEQYINQ